MILQIEWMTQQHYVDSVRDDAALDPPFASLLRHHWMEEAQHAKLDARIVETLASDCRPEEIDEAFAGYASIGEVLAGALARQVELDLETVQRATGRRLRSFECDVFLCRQRRATRWTFLGSGMRHPRFLATVGALRPEARAHIEEITPAFC